MFILKEHVQAETAAGNSRFLSELFIVSSPEEARSVWHERKENCGNGGHIVFAFITGPQGNVMGCSDDGEPSGTAGRPTLEVLKGSGLTNVILTTARWFGGTLLGTGGLVRAYTAGAQKVLEKAEKIPLVPVSEMTLECAYPLYETVRRLLEGFHGTVTEESFTEKVVLSFRLEKKLVPLLKERLRDLSCGKILCREKEEASPQKL